jgi:hypothetical protein
MTSSIAPAARRGGHVDGQLALGSCLGSYLSTLETLKLGGH